MILRNLLSGDEEGILYITSLLGSVLSLLFLSEYQPALSPKIAAAFAVLGLIPVTLLSVVIGGHAARGERLTFAAFDTPPTLIPAAANHWRIHVGPYTTTYHYTAAIALIMLIHGLVLFNQSKQKSFFLLQICAGYLILFSGARVGLISSVAVLLMFWGNVRKRRPLFSWAVLALSVVSIYRANSVGSLLPNIDNEVLSSLIPVAREANSDVTTDRSWLWRYHLDLFQDHPFLGSGQKAVSFQIGDIVDGQVATAASESYYTQVLAAFGLTGLSLVGIHLYLFSKSLRHPDLTKTLLATAIIVGTAANGMFANVYLPATFYAVAYICLGLNQKSREGSQHGRSLSLSSFSSPRPSAIKL